MSLSALQDELEALPKGSKEYKLEPEKEQLLLKYWPTRNHEQVAKVLGMSSATALRYYRRLCSKGA